MTSPDKLRRLLDERGAEWERGKTLPDYTVWKDANGREYDATVSMFGEGLLVGGLTPEQAIAATLGSRAITAEQVREAVMSADRWEKPMGNTGLTNTHLIIRDDGWQAIADELNAELGKAVKR